MGFYRVAPQRSLLTMKIALATGFLAYQVMCSFSLRTRDCVSVKEACISGSPACRSGWDLLKKVCSVSEESCRLVESVECNMTMAYLLGQFPDWEGCLCAEEDHCRTPQLLAPNCHSHQGGQTSKQPPSGRGWFQRDMSLASVSPQGQGCLSVLRGCQQSPRCWSAYRKLRSSCRSGQDQCHVLVSRSSCQLLWGELKSTPLANCTCPVAGKRCLKVQALLQNSPCIHAEQDSLAPSLPKAIHQNTGKVKVKKDPNIDWQKSGLLEEARGNTAGSCLHAMTACVHDAVCNAQLVPLVRACSEGQCQAGACGRTTRHFYQGLPPAAADALVFCECPAGDLDCLRVRADLQGGTCAGASDRMPTCLEVYDRCLQEPLCRQRYRMFQSSCFGEEAETLCPDHAPGGYLCPPDPVLIQGGDGECRRAFVGTMGTVLQQPCSCDGLLTPHLLQCQRIRDVFQDRHVFISHLKKEVSEHHTTLENASQPRGQRFSDQLFFALICVLVVVLILMVVIIVLSTSGLCRREEKAKFHPPPDTKNIPAFC